MFGNRRSSAAQSFTLMRNTWAQDSLRVNAEELAMWIPSTLGEQKQEEPETQPVVAEEPATVESEAKQNEESSSENAEVEKHAQKAVDAFFNSLMTGESLCRLIEKCSPASNWPSGADKPVPDVVCKFKANVKPGSFQARENIAAFVEACKQLGIPQISLFTDEDLVGRKNDKQVINCLLHLARIATQNGVRPPQIVQYEIDIDRERNSEEEGVEEFLPAQYGLTQEQIDAVAQVFQELDENGDVKPSPKELCAALKNNEAIIALKHEDFMFGNKVELLDSQDANPTDLGDFLAWWNFTSKAKLKRRPSESKADLESQPVAARPRALTHTVHDRFDECVHLPFVPRPDDPIDAALAAEVNLHMLDVRIRRFVGQEGTYVIGKGNKTRMRLVRGLLMVRDGSTWEGVVRYAQRKLAEILQQ